MAAWGWDGSARIKTTVIWDLIYVKGKISKALTTENEAKEWGVFVIVGAKFDVVECKVCKGTVSRGKVG